MPSVLAMQPIHLARVEVPKTGQVSKNLSGRHRLAPLYEQRSQNHDQDAVYLEPVQFLAQQQPGPEGGEKGGEVDDDGQLESSQHFKGMVH
jgi:hypothetical protein